MLLTGNTAHMTSTYTVAVAGLGSMGMGMATSLQ